MIRQLLLDRLALAAQVAGNGQARFHRREQLGALLHHLGEAFFHQAVQNLVNFLARHVGARRQFQRLEPRVTQ